MKEIIIGILPGCILLLVFIISMILSFLPKKKPPRIDIDEEGNVYF